jgi:hypothetical protein
MQAFWHGFERRFMRHSLHHGSAGFDSDIGEQDGICAGRAAAGRLKFVPKMGRVGSV